MSQSIFRCSLSPLQCSLPQGFLLLGVTACHCFFCCSLSTLQPRLAQLQCHIPQVFFLPAATPALQPASGIFLLAVSLPQAFAAHSHVTPAWSNFLMRSPTPSRKSHRLVTRPSINRRSTPATRNEIAKSHTIIIRQFGVFVFYCHPKPPTSPPSPYSHVLCTPLFGSPYPTHVSGTFLALGKGVLVFMVTTFMMAQNRPKSPLPTGHD